MGFDVTYHPVSEQSLHRLYFDFVLGHANVEQRCAERGIDPIFTEKLVGWVAHDQMLPAGSSFDTTIGWHAAAAAGIFTRFHYLRGSLLSALTPIGEYTKSWKEIVPSLAGHHDVRDRVFENYCSGVYIPADNVSTLRNDLVNNSSMREEVEHHFPGESLGVLLTALDEAIGEGCGLLEATDVIEPNPLNLNATGGAANRLNCDPTGPLLYEQAVMAQLADGGLGDELANGNVERIVVHTNPGTTPRKKSFFDRLRR